jgi:hypothetical protein
MAPRINPIGVCTHLNGLSTSDVDKQLNLIQAIGIQWIRQEISWTGVEPTQGTWTFAPYDYIVSGIAQRGMQMIAMLPQYHVPAWYGSPSNQPPAVSDYTSYVQAVVSHYSGQIPFYEVGNEPNVGNFWYPHTDAVAYSALLKATYPVIKTTDPNTKVISGGLSQPNPETFLTTMYSNGVQGYMDYIGYHPYSWPNSPDYIGSVSTFNELAALKTIMNTNGDSNKQIMATEVGWPTSTNQVNEATQSAYIQRVYQKVMHEDYQYVAIACVYDFIDDGTDITNPELNFGLLHTDYSAKPSSAAIQAARSDYNANFSSDALTMAKEQLSTTTRDGTISTTTRDGKTKVSSRDGKITATARDGKTSTKTRDGMVSTKERG